MNKKMTLKEYHALPMDYRSEIDGQPYALYMDENGITVLGPIEVVNESAYTRCMGHKRLPDGTVYRCVLEAYHPGHCHFATFSIHCHDHHTEKPHKSGGAEC